MAPGLPFQASRSTTSSTARPGHRQRLRRASVVDWEPSQAETPAPSPTWAWVSLLLLVAFGVFYGVQQWSPTRDFAHTDLRRHSAGPEARSRRPQTRRCRARPLQAPTATAQRARPGRRGSSARGRRARRGSLLRQLRRLPPADRPGPGRGVPAAGERPGCPDARSDGSHRTVLNGKRGSMIGGVSYASPMPAFKDHPE